MLLNLVNRLLRQVLNTGAVGLYLRRSGNVTRAAVMQSAGTRMDTAESGAFMQKC
jgi:hypothetical protein